MLDERGPSGPLSLHIDRLWHCGRYDAPHRQERVLPSGALHLVLDLKGGGGVAVGIQTRSTLLDTSAIGSTLGVVFRPGGARSFFPSPDEFGDAAVPLDAVWGDSSRQLIARMQEASSAAERFDLLEADLLRRIRPAPLHPAVSAALHAASSIRRVRDLSRDAGLSSRRFGQLFREQVGIAPKLYCRIRRFQAVVQDAARGEEVDWAAVAADGGYADQSHLSHEFREFSGLTPSAWLASSRPFANHVVVA
jgi:AraC-like DNA-binding protein